MDNKNVFKKQCMFCFTISEYRMIESFIDNRFTAVKRCVLCHKCRNKIVLNDINSLC